MISSSKTVIIPAGEQQEEEQSQVVLLKDSIIQRISNPDTEIIEPICSRFANDSRYKQNVINDLAGDVIKNQIPNLLFEGFSNDRTANEIRKDFSRTIASKLASTILGVTIMTEETTQAASFSALKTIPNPENVKKILTYRDDIGGSGIARINIFRVEYKDGSFEFRIAITPHNHNSAR
jgi:hypothetical protein